MADPVSILGTVVGVASLAIQVTQILHSYCSSVSEFRTDIEGLLIDAKQLSEVLAKLEEFLEGDLTKLSVRFTMWKPEKTPNLQAVYWHIECSDEILLPSFTPNASGTPPSSWVMLTKIASTSAELSSVFPLLQNNTTRMICLQVNADSEFGTEIFHYYINLIFCQHSVRDQTRITPQGFAETFARVEGTKSNEGSEVAFQSSANT